MANHKPLNVVRFAGPSQQGKTTLIAQLLRELEPQYSIAVIKHSHHPLSLPAKDSTLFSQEGASFSLAIGTNAVTLTLPPVNKTPEEWIHWLFPDVDIVFIEGWREHSFPTIIVCAEKPDEEWLFPTEVVGYIGWTPDETAIKFDGVGDIAAFIKAQYLS